MYLVVGLNITSIFDIIILLRSDHLEGFEHQKLIISNTSIWRMCFSTCSDIPYSDESQTPIYGRVFQICSFFISAFWGWVFSGDFWHHFYTQDWKIHVFGEWLFFIGKKSSSIHEVADPPSTTDKQTVASNKSLEKDYLTVWIILVIGGIGSI